MEREGRRGRGREGGRMDGGTEGRSPHTIDDVTILKVIRFGRENTRRGGGGCAAYQLPSRSR